MSFDEIQWNQIDIDMKIYKVVHTGPKTHDGGLKGGCIIWEYQGSLKIDVTTPPIAEAIKVIKTIIIKDKYLLLNIIMKYNLSWWQVRRKFGLQEQAVE